MSRHNRRRTRIGHQNRASAQRHSFELPALFQAEAFTPKIVAPPLQAHRGDLTAKHWQNRYIAWQNREKKQREEQNRLLEARKRIFGGESDEGDDEGLCAKMMEYFNGLDYIEG